MPLAVDIKLMGAPELRNKLNRLPTLVQKRVMRPAVNFALTPMNAAAKRRAPVETGLLRQSLGKKIKQYANSGTTWGAVGVRKGFGVKVAKGATATVRVGKRETVIESSRDPRFYVHLVELGHKIRRKKRGPVLGFRKGTRFLTKAYEATKDIAMVRLVQKVEKGIAKEATRK